MKHPSRAVAPGATSPDAGVTLTELLVVLIILPVVMGAIALGLMSVMSTDQSVSTRINNAAGSQIVNSVYASDVQSATAVTTGPNVQCGPSGATQELGLAWDGTGKTFRQTVSYSLVGTSLWRYACLNGGVVNQRLISDAIDIAAQSSAAVSCSQGATCPDTSSLTDILTNGIAVVTLPVSLTDAAANYTLGAATGIGANDAVQGPQALFAPLNVVSTSCTGASAAFQGSGSLTLQGPDGNALPLAVTATCSSAVPSTVAAAAVFTPRATLGSYADTTKPEYYSADIATSLASFGTSLPAAPSASGSSSVTSCTQSSGVYVCPPGTYPGSFPFVSGGTYYMGYAVGGYCSPGPANSRYDYHFATLSTTLSAATHATLSPTATWTSLSKTLTLSSTTGVLVGDFITGTGIPAGDTIASVSVAPAKTVTLTSATTSAGSGVSVAISQGKVSVVSNPGGAIGANTMITIAGTTPETVTVAQSSGTTLTLKTAITTAHSSGAAVSLPSTGSIQIPSNVTINWCGYKSQSPYTYQFDSSGVAIDVPSGAFFQGNGGESVSFYVSSGSLTFEAGSQICLPGANAMNHVSINANGSSSVTLGASTSTCVSGGAAIGGIYAPSTTVALKQNGAAATSLSADFIIAKSISITGSVTLRLTEL